MAGRRRRYAAGLSPLTAVTRHELARSCLRGFDHAGVENRSGVSPLGAVAAIPWLVTTDSVVPGHVLVAAVWLDRGGLESAIPAVAIDHDTISLRWSDGLDTQVTLPNP